MRCSVPRTPSNRILTRRYVPIYLSSLSLHIWSLLDSGELGFALSKLDT